MTEARAFLHDGPEIADMTLILAHGAGAGMDTPFMNTMAVGLAEHGVRVLRFEFPYMTKRRQDGKRRPPDRQPVLLDAWRAAVSGAGAGRVAIGGKSMGGRMASLIADDVGATALVCLGYPFHPPGKPERTRTDHLQRISTPTLILQGERDPFGTRNEVDAYPLSNSIRIHWLADGNHDLAPRKKSGHTHERNMEDAVKETIDFLKSV